jgi:hypothetical protein
VRHQLTSPRAPAGEDARRSEPQPHLEQPVFDAEYQRHAAVLPTGRAYATVIVGAMPTTADPLGDQALDAFDILVSHLAPAAVAVRATPEVSWWHIPEAAAADLLSVWMHPGPVIEVHWGVDSRFAAHHGSRAPLRVDLVTLVAYWRAVLEQAGSALAALGHERCAVALGLQTFPAAGGTLVDVDTSIVRDGRRSGAHEAPPPWRFEVGVTAVENAAAETLLQTAVDRLLRHFSYRHTDRLVDAVVLRARRRWSPDMAAAQAVQE